MKEIWKITHISSNYLISNHGRVKSISRLEEVESRRCKSYSRRRNGRYLRLIKNKIGYIQVGINGKAESVHRLVAIAFIDNPENKPQVNHKDLNKTNNIVTNLEWVTHKENARHAYDAGVYPPPQELFAGEKSIAAKLNNKQVKNIKLMLLNGSTLKYIAEKYGLCSSTIGWINKGYSYSDVGVEYKGDTVYAPKVTWMKRIICKTIDGQIIREYDSARHASEHLNIRSAAIRKALSGIQETSGGYKWDYADAKD